ncbi:MAG: nitrate/nitrite transporter NrtS [Desulfobacterales bacterium]
MIKNWMRLAFSRPVCWRAVKVSALVGPILVAVNQGDVLLQGGLNFFCWLKIGLTIMVPYFVSTVSSVAALKDCSTDDV